MPTVTWTDQYGLTLENAAQLFANTSEAQTWTGEVDAVGAYGHVVFLRDSKPLPFPALLISFSPNTMSKKDAQQQHAVHLDGAIFGTFIGSPDALYDGDPRNGIKDFARSVFVISAAMEALSDSDITKLQDLDFNIVSDVDLMDKTEGHPEDIYVWTWQLRLNK